MYKDFDKRVVQKRNVYNNSWERNQQEPKNLLSEVT